LRSLSFTPPGRDLAALRALAETPELARLTSLTLFGNHLEEEDALILARSPYLTGLRFVNLGVFIGNPLVGPLIASPHLANLRWLWLPSNAISIPALEGLARAPFLPNLTILNLLWCQLDDSGAAVLASSLGPPLRHLLLGSNNFSAEGVRSLTRLGDLSTLTRLDLASSPIGQAGAEALAACPALARLRRLDLSRCDLGAPAAEALARSPHLAGLRFLSLSDNHLGDAGADALLESPHLQNVQHLALNANRIGREAKKRLKGRFGRRVML
jgi:Leucine-rich repeat (LRR) protein